MPSVVKRSLRMSTSENVSKCWESLRWPIPELLDGLKGGTFKSARLSGEKSFKELISRYRRDKVAKPTIFIGAGTCGLGAGAGKTLETVRAYLKEKNISADLIEVGCVGLCSEEPILDVQLPGRTRVSFRGVSFDKAEDLLNKVFAGIIPEDMLLGQYRPVDSEQKIWKDVAFLDEHPFLSIQRRVVLANSGIVDPGNIDEYIARGGFSALAKALKTMTPDEVCTLVLDSGLRGRGGAGFPTGRKWMFARKAVSDQKYLICNADEGDPGAFMDRAVCESDPYRLIEGLVIAAYAIGATKAYIYIRAEYPLAIDHLKKAMEQARAYGLIGENILDSGNDLEIVIKMGRRFCLRRGNGSYSQHRG